MSYAEIEKFHLQLAHGTLATLERVLKVAGKNADATTVRQVLAVCGRPGNFRDIRKPLLSSYVAKYPCHTVRIDIFQFPHKEKAVEFLILVDGLTRLIVVCRLRKLPNAVLLFLYVYWAWYFGRINVALMDKGPGLIGQDRGNFAESWGTPLIYCATGAAHSNGVVKRQIDLFKNVMLNLCNMHPAGNINVLLNRGVMAKNLTHNRSSGITPMQGAIGRPGLLWSAGNTA